jgi:hypothetical protein
MTWLAAATSFTSSPLAPMGRISSALQKENHLHVHIFRSPRDSEVGYSAEELYWQTFLA